MDASNRYAMMCQRASEIQNSWRPRPCDVIIEISDLDEGISFCKPAASIVQVANMYYDEQDEENYLKECDEMKEQALWLPRQDQLQRMFEPDTAKIFLLMNQVIGKKYRDYAKNVIVDAPELFFSMEQLWLAYIMKEKFNKVWNEEQWVSD